MKFLGFAKRLKDTSALVQELRDHGINVNGPFRRRNGTFIYSLAGCVVTERELPDLPNTGKLTLPAFRNSPPRSLGAVFSGMGSPAISLVHE
jgi:hypothetical protein